MISAFTRSASRFVPPAAAVFCAACHTTTPPRVHVLEAAPVDQSDVATRVDVMLEAVNPNDQPLPLVEFEYALTLDGREVFESRRAAQATIPQNAAQQLIIPVLIPHDALEGVPAGRHEYALSGSLTYIAPGALGEVLFDTGVRRPQSRFSGAGAINFDVMASQGPRVEPGATAIQPPLRSTSNSPADEDAAGRP